jgi:hypothetical protein
VPQPTPDSPYGERRAIRCKGPLWPGDGLQQLRKLPLNTVLMTVTLFAGSRADRRRSRQGKPAAPCCGRLTPSQTGPGADQATRSLGEAKKSRSRPMRSCNPFGDHGQRAISFALIFKLVFANQHGMGVSAPVPHQSRAGLQHDTGIAGSAGFARACGQVLQAAPQHPTRPAAVGSGQCNRRRELRQIPPGSTKSEPRNQGRPQGLLSD